jgi:LCP family protein required for cell wall assembly
MSALVLLVSGGAWALTGYINGAIKRVDAGTTNPGSTGPLNILVAGVDPRTGLTHHQQVVLHVGSDVSSNSDTMMLAHVSGDRSRVTVVSIPRDSWVSIPGHGMNKINAAYGFGGAKLMVQTVEQATGLSINDYAEVNFLGFVKVIDALGGVNICLPQAVDDPYTGLRLPAGTHHVNGITALAYARDRHSFATSDLARIQDQQRLMSSALSEAIHSGLLANPIRLSQFMRAALSALTVDRYHQPGRDVHHRAAGQRELPDADRRIGGAVGQPGRRPGLPAPRRRPAPHPTRLPAPGPSRLPVQVPRAAVRLLVVLLVHCGLGGVGLVRSGLLRVGRRGRRPHGRPERLRLAAPATAMAPLRGTQPPLWRLRIHRFVAFFCFRGMPERARIRSRCGRTTDRTSETPAIGAAGSDA